jgi:predicted CoA-binding protein
VTTGSTTLPWLDPEAIRFMLEDCATWAVVGLSGDPSRTAYSIAALLQRHGKRIVPVNPKAETVHGEQGYASLADVPFPVDVVDVFRRSADAGGHVDEAVAAGAKAVWLQLDVIDEAAADRAEAAGLDVVMDHCPAIEWSAHGPR